MQLLAAQIADAERPDCERLQAVNAVLALAVRFKISMTLYSVVAGFGGIFSHKFVDVRTTSVLPMPSGMSNREEQPRHWDYCNCGTQESCVIRQSSVFSYHRLAGCFALRIA